MSKLDDYSGPFDSALTIDNLSAECLTKLMRQWAAAYVRLDEAWASLLKPKVSEGELYETEKQVWIKVAAITLRFYRLAVRFCLGSQEPQSRDLARRCLPHQGLL